MGELEVGDLVATVPEGTQDGDRLLYIQERWLLRPGELVPVALKKETWPAGFYVPLQAILRDGEAHSVFLATQDADAIRAHRAQVRVLGTLREFRRIESHDVVAGSRIILAGAHHVVDGEEVRVSSVEKAAP